MLTATPSFPAVLSRFTLALMLVGLFTAEATAQSFQRIDGSTEARPANAQVPSRAIQFGDATAKVPFSPPDLQARGLRVLGNRPDVTITHSGSQTITPETGIACSAAGSTSRNSYWRVFDLDEFDLASGLTVTSVDIGIEAANLAAGPVASTVRLHRLNGTFTTANLTLVAEAAYIITDADDEALVNVPIEGEFGANAVMVVEWDVPNLQDVGDGVFFGANTDGQTGPTYVSAEACSLTEPTDLASINFPDVAWVLSVNGTTDGGVTDEIEPNDSPVQAQVLTGASPIVVNGQSEVGDVGTIEIPYQGGFQDDVEDLFRVTTAAAGLTLTLNGFTADLDLGLWNSDGTTQVELSNGVGDTEMITLPSLPAGTYLVGVTIYDEMPGSTTSAYTLTIEGNITEDGPPPAPSGLTATAGDGEVALAWSAVNVPDLVGYHVYRATSPFTESGAATRLTSAPEDDSDYDDVAVTNGTQYYYRVSAIDAGGNEGPLSNQASATPINPRPPTVSVAVNRSFGDPETQANYRIVALPGNVNETLASTLDGTTPDNWRAFQERGSASGNGSSLGECTSGCRFAPGEGFWLLADAPWSVSEAFPTVNINSGGYAISVHPGWNIISNPLEIDVSWQRVQETNDVSRALNQWSGRWQETSSFASARRGEAFYFFNTGLTSLTIPFAPAAQPEPVAPAERGAASPWADGGFELSLTVRVGGEETAIAAVAAGSEAEVGLDDYDRFAPPSTFEQASLAVTNEALETDYRLLRHDMRPVDENGYSFDLVLSATPGTEVEVMPAWAPEGEVLEAVLVHAISGERHALSAGAPVRLRNASRTTRYVLHLGSPAFVDADRALPQEVEVVGYPNPFQGVTTVRYGLTERAPVRLAVYDLLGKRVAVLASGEAREAGYHTAVWDATGLATGVYVYVLEAGTQRLTGKLTVL